LHYHRKKEETFLVVSGEVDLDTISPWSWGKDKSYLQSRRCVVGDFFTIAPKVLAHRFQHVSGDVRIVEASTFHSDDDVVRLEPSGPIKG
jgi:uncharacterized cupin superfamily protein